MYRLTTPPHPAFTWTVTAYSEGTNDTKITVNYSYGGVPATASSVMVTKRLFYYLANDSLSLYTTYSGPTEYGYTYYAYYNVFTHPDHGEVTDGESIGTTETVTQTSSNVSVVPNYSQGGLNLNSQVQDLLQLTSSTPLPATLKIVDSQDIGVGGFIVRSNTITFTGSNVSVQSGGPSN